MMLRPLCLAAGLLTVLCGSPAAIAADECCCYSRYVQTDVEVDCWIDCDSEGGEECYVWGMCSEVISYAACLCNDPVCPTGCHPMECGDTRTGSRDCLLTYGEGCPSPETIDLCLDECNETAAFDYYCSLLGLCCGITGECDHL